MLSEKEQEIWSRGAAAAVLLASPDFIDVIRSLTLESYAVFTETQPQETAAREDTYNLMRGLKAIEAELNARVQAKDEIERKLEAAEHNAEEEPIEDVGPDGEIIIQGD